MKQSFSWWSFCRDRVDGNHLLREAARIGYAGVELVGEEWWQPARDAGLTVASIAGHGTIPDGLNRRENHDRIEEEIARNLEKAQAWGIPNLIVFSGNRREGLTDADGAAITAEGLARLAPLASQAGVTLILELLNSKINHAGYQADRTAWGVDVCCRVASPHVKLLYDIYHMQVMEGDVIHTLTGAVDHIGHFHTAGVPGRRDLDDTQELNYPAIACAIAATGFAGYLGHEFLPKGDAVDALKQAYKIFDI